MAKNSRFLACALQFFEVFWSFSPFSGLKKSLSDGLRQNDFLFLEFFRPNLWQK